MLNFKIKFKHKLKRLKVKRKHQIRLNYPLKDLKCNSSSIFNLRSLICSSINIKRVAFADKLKEELKEELNLSEGNKEDIRQKYVEYAKEKKKIDINYF